MTRPIVTPGERRLSRLKTRSLTNDPREALVRLRPAAFAGNWVPSHSTSGLRSLPVSGGTILWLRLALLTDLQLFHRHIHDLFADRKACRCCRRWCVEHMYVITTSFNAEIIHHGTIAA